MCCPGFVPQACRLPPALPRPTTASSGLRLRGARLVHSLRSLLHNPAPAPATPLTPTVGLGRVTTSFESSVLLQFFSAFAHFPVASLNLSVSLPAQHRGAPNGPHSFQSGRGFGRRCWSRAVAISELKPGHIQRRSVVRPGQGLRKHPFPPPSSAPPTYSKSRPSSFTAVMALEEQGVRSRAFVVK